MKLQPLDRSSIQTYIPKEADRELTSKHYGIVLSALTTAFLHLFLFIRLGPDPITLNGLGYLALLGAYFLPIRLFQHNRRLVWWALFGYTALTFVLWVILGDKRFTFDFSNTSIGYYAKTAELFLMGFLWADRPKS